MNLPPAGCKLTGNGVHQWILIDKFVAYDDARLYLFACRFCLVAHGRTDLGLQVISTLEEEPAVA